MRRKNILDSLFQYKQKTIKKMKRFMTFFAAIFFAVAAVFSQSPAQSQAIMLQGFYWDSQGATSWNQLYAISGDISRQFDFVWLPPSARSTPGSVGYHPYQLSDQNSAWGTRTSLVRLIQRLRSTGTTAIADIVVNHRGNMSNWCDFYPDNFGYPFGDFQFDTRHIVGNDPMWTDPQATLSCRQTPANMRGANKPAHLEMWHAARNLDHSSAYVRAATRAYLRFLRDAIGYGGWRWDIVKGMTAGDVGYYNWDADNNRPLAEISVGEYWDNDWNRLWSWIQGTSPNPAHRSMAFDFPFQYRAARHNWNGTNWIDLTWLDGTVRRPLGLVHSPLTRRHAVTFLDNHDTSRYGHSRFNGCVLRGHAFMLSAPGIPCIFYPHWINPNYRTAIESMILARRSVGLHSESVVEVQTWTGFYKAFSRGTCGDMLTFIGPNSASFAHDLPNTQTTNWNLAASGNGWAIFTYITNQACLDAYNARVANIVNPVVPTFTSITITVTVPAAWTAPRIHSWIPATGQQLTVGAWPGQTMTHVSGNTWTITFSGFPPATTVGFVFNNGATPTAQQTNDLFAEGDVCFVLDNTPTGGRFGATEVPCAPTAPTVGNIAAPAAVCSGENLTLPAVPTVTGNPTSQGWQINRGGNWVAFANPVTTADTQLRYFATNAAGTAYSNVQNITVNVAPTVGNITAPAAVCSGATLTLTAPTVTGNPTSRGWQVFRNDNWIAFNPATAVTSADQRLRYFATNACGTTNSNEVNITVITAPTVGNITSAALTACAGENLTLPASPTVTGENITAQGWQINRGGSWVAFANPVTTADTQLRYFATNACGTAHSGNTINITVSAAPATPTVISGSASICANSTQSYSVEAVSGAVSYVWTLPAGWSGSSTTNVINVIAGAEGGTIRVRAVNACGESAEATLYVSITTNVTPSVVIVSDGSTICTGETVNFTASPSNGGPTPVFQWFKNGNPVGTDSPTFSDNTLVSGDVITVQMTSDDPCVLGDRTVTSNAITMTVNAAPAAIGAITGTTSVCPGTVQVFSVDAVSGADSYVWTLPAGWISEGSTTNSITVTVGEAGGTISVKAVNACGESNTASLTVAIIDAPAQPSSITGAVLVYEGDIEVYSVANVAGISYKWTVPAGWLIQAGDGTNSITVMVGAESGFITVTPVNQCGVAGQSSQLSVTVDERVSAPVVTQNKTTIIAYGNTVQINDAAVGEIVSIFNLLGSRVYSQRVSHNPEFITGLAPGVFVVVIEGTNVRQKVLIVR